MFDECLKSPSLWQTIETITATKLRQEQQLAMAFDNRELRTWSSGSSIFGYLEFLTHSESAS